MIIGARAITLARKLNPTAEEFQLCSIMVVLMNHPAELTADEAIAAADDLSIVEASRAVLEHIEAIRRLRAAWLPVPKGKKARRSTKERRAA